MKTKKTQTSLSSSLLEIMRNVEKAFQGKFAKILSQQCFSQVRYPHEHLALMKFVNHFLLGD